MVAVKTGFTPPPMPGMPAPMQPMGGLPPMPPMGGPGTFPVPQGGNPFAPLPPMPLAGMPPPMGGPGTFPVSPNTQVPQQQQQQQQGSNAPRRKRFGDSLESMLGRNQGLGATAPQQRMVAPGTPMMRTPPMGRGMPRPMNQGGIVQYMEGAGEVLSNEELVDIFTEDTSWVDPDYGYNSSSPRAPNMREVMEKISGRNVEDIYSTGEDYSDLANQASQFLYGPFGYASRFNKPVTVSVSSGSNNAGSVSSGSDNADSGSDQASAVRQAGDVGSFSRGLEGAALFGPSIDTAPVSSQFVQNPTTGAITTTAGPTMTSVSPIGSIVLPASPVDIDISDYLAEPVFGSMSPIEKNMGGAVPRQTNIAGQPHMLSYINQDEEALLRSFGGSGIAGPGGIPSYPPTGVTSSGGSGASTSFDSGYKPITTNYKDDDDNSSSSSDKMSFDDEDYTPTSSELNQQLSDSGQTNITTNFSNVNYDTTGSGDDYDTAAQADTNVSGAEFVALGGLGSGGSGASTGGSGVNYSLGSDDPVVFTDIMGRTYNNAADRDRANLGYQQASYQQGSQALRGTLQGFKQFGDFDSDEEAYRRGAANFAADPPKGTDLSYYNLQNTPDIFTDMFNQPIMPPILPPKIGSGDDDDKDDSDQDKASKYNNMLALETEFGPAEGGYSLIDLKKRISLAEGTSDKDGYKRLLGGQETKNFKIDPTKMTVQEILDFQKKRGEGTYSEYSRAINEKLGKVNKDGTGVISTPVGKYQVVGSTLQGLVDQGIVDPNEKFDENTQERIGTHLITTDLAGGKGLEDLKTGDMTIDEFETALGKQFEGIELGLDDLAKIADEGDASDIQLESGDGTEVNIFDPDNKEVIPPNTGDSEKDDESGQNVSNQDKDKDKDEDEITVTTLPKLAEKVEQITEYTDKDGKTTVDDPDTPQNEAVVAQLGLGSSVADVAATGRDIGVPNAAESAFLMEALNEMEFDDKGNLVGAEPNFLEETMGKIIKNLTLGAFDPNDPQKGEDAKAILDAYQKTGKFVYDGKEMSLTELIKASKEEGIEPAVIGVEGADGSTVGFDDGTGFRNIMGDYNPVYKDGQVFSGGSDTQNILTGSTDVFGNNTNTNNTATKITTSGGDDSGGSDGGGDVDTGHTVDENGNKVCNTEGYVYNPETKICEPKKVEEKDLTIDVMRGEDFDDVLGRVTTAAPNIGSISGNVQNMQEGGMAGLNRAADNFLQALAG